jgi:integral membrane sensor domain MASE1/anti-sigma regulatory factor (Ser/Thr protein kinase)/GAF domain-containing protein
MGLFATVATAYAVCSQLAFSWFAADGVNSSFFPAAGVTLGALLLTERRDWVVVAAAAGTAEFTLDVIHDIGPLPSAGYAIANMVEPLVGATLVLTFVGRRPDLSRMKHLGSFLVGSVILAPALGGALGATNNVMLAGGEEWLRFAGEWWIGDGLGALVVGGTMVAVALTEKRPHRVSSLENVALSAGAIVATGLAFALKSASLIYIPVTLLFVLALRAGTRSVAIVGAAMAFVGAEATANGHVFWETINVTPEVGIVYLQMAMAVIIATALALSAATAQNERSTLAFASAEASRREADSARQRAEVLHGMAEELGRAGSREEIAAVVSRRGLRLTPDEDIEPQAVKVVSADAASGAYADDEAILIASTVPMVRDAIHRVRLLRAERVSRTRAELLERHASRLAAAATVHDVAEATVGELSSAGIEMCALRIVRNEQLIVVGTGGMGPDVLPRVGSLGLDDTPSADAIRRGAVVELSGAETIDLRNPGNTETRRRLGVESLLVVPLRAANDRVIGALSVMSTSPAGLPVAVRQIALGVAEQCGVALDRAALAEAEHKARLRSEGFAAMAFGLAAAVSSTDAARTLLQHASIVLCAEAGLVAVASAGADEQLSVRARLSGSPAANSSTERLEALLAVGDVTSGPEFFDIADLFTRDVSAPTDVEGGKAVVVRLLGSAGTLQGVLALGFRASQELSEEDHSVLVGLAAQAGQALERVALFEVERDLRARAELLERHAARLTAVTTAHEAGEATVAALEELGSSVSACWFGVGHEIRLLASGGVTNPAVLDHWLTRDSSPVPDALRDGCLRERLGRVTDVDSAGAPDCKVLSVAVPLCSQTGVAGALLVMTGDRNWLHNGRRSQLLGLADQCALALQRIESHTRVEAAAAANAVLAQISETMDFATTVSGRAKRLVEALIANGAARAEARLIGSDDTVSTVAVAVSDHVEIGAEDAVAELELRARGRMLGTLLVHGGERLHGSPPLHEVAGRAAVAIDNAKIYERERDVSHDLQIGLLTTELPTVEGLGIEAAYRAGTEALEVGGDWYDAFMLPSGRLGIVVGDVVGHNLQAATAMAQLRGAARALAAFSSPVELLERLDAFVETVPNAAMSTMAYVELDPLDATLRYACAGHPPPLIATFDGTARLLWDGRSPPLGCFQTRSRTEGVDRLEPAGRLVLYTDGLIERRGQDIHEGLNQLAHISALDPVGCDGFADRLCDLIIDRRSQEDDACVISVERVDETVFTYCFPARASELAALRQRLRSWLTHQSATKQVEQDLVLATCEAATNSIEHAYHSASPKTVTVAMRATHADIDVVVRDHGRWVQPTPNHLRRRGLPIISAVMTDVAIEPDEFGTAVRMRYSLLDPRD